MDRINDIECIVRTELARIASVRAAYLFGSTVAGTPRSDSDVDIALMLEPGSRLEAVDRWKLAGALGREFGRVVDIGIIDSRNLVYANQVLTTGRRLFARDSASVGLYECALLGMYLSFVQERREIVNAYRAG